MSYIKSNSLKMKTSFIVLFVFCYSVCSSQQKKQHELFFDSGKDILTESSIKTIDSLFNKIKPEKISSVKIYGYCDSIGNKEYNNKLSIKRAQKAKAYISEKGILSDSIFIKGYGKTNQKYKSIKWDKNRRVSFELYFKKKTTPKKTVIEKPIEKIKPTDTIKTEIENFVTNSEIGDKMALKNITFYGGTDKPMTISFKTLEELVNTLKDNPTLEIAIEGHICCSTTDEDDLSGRRAKTVYNYLIGFGIAKKRLSFKGFGHTQPLTEERNSEEQQMNRRVEIRILKK